MLRHTPILVDEILAMIPLWAQFFLDGTLGHWGHAEYVLKQRLEQKPNIQQNIQYIWVDRDPAMLAKAQGFLSQYDHIRYIQSSYADLERISTESGIAQFDRMLLDIGVNMDHFKTAERGFSIKMDGPLDMRFDTSEGITASQRLARVKDTELRQALTDYSDFRPKVIDTFIKFFYQNKTIFTTTHQLVQFLQDAGMNQKMIAIVFQVIRIVINGELNELQTFLTHFPKYLAVGGRCAFLTFHSIEDRMVKLAFKQLVDTGTYQLINKHVIKPSRVEQQRNKASRSCKLRVIEKII